MSQPQTSPPRKKGPSAYLFLACGCLGILLCMGIGVPALKFLTTKALAVESDYEPAWSPDGEQIAFSSTRDGMDIYVMQSDGTNAVRLTNSFFSLALFARNTEPAWSPDGEQIAFTSNRAGHDEIYIMNSDGSQERRLTNAYAEGKSANASPDWSPDGKQILFTSQVGSFAFGIPEDPDDFPTSDLHRIDVDGTHLTRLTDLGGLVQSPKWSPDGSRIAFVLVKGGSDIYIMDAGGTNVLQVTDDPASEQDLAWSPDGTRLAFTSGDIYHNDIYIMDADGSHVEQLTHTSGIGTSSPSWSPDGEQIAFNAKLPNRLEKIFIVDADGSHLIQLTD